MTTLDEMGPLLITVPELGTVTDDDEAARACALASGIVLDYIGRPVLSDTYSHTLPVHADIVVRDSDAPSGTVGVVRLPVSPVDEVTQVSVDDVVLADDQWSWDTSRGQLLIDDPGAYEATVEYTAGYEEIPVGLRAVARRIALDILANRNGVRSEQVGDYSVTYYTGGDFTKLEQRILDRYRVAVGTIRPA